MNSPIKMNIHRKLNLSPSYVMVILATGLCLTSRNLIGQELQQATGPYDVVIYGGTSAGVAAAVQVSRMGKSVALIEPSQRLGGLTSGGLGQTDIGNKAAIGGIALEFYKAVRRHYQKPEAWKWQTKEQYQDSGQTRTLEGEQAMWTFEPGVAAGIYQDWVRSEGIKVYYGERLERSSGAEMTRSRPWRLQSIRMESGKLFRAKVFLDATYEGDLMALAGVSYTVGREANSLYGETLNGVQTAHARYHQLQPGIDPYIRPGDPSSGLLPHIDPDGPGEEGEGDHRVQAYCFRMCLTDHPDNRIPFHKPDGYDPLWYELLLRNYEAGETGMPWINSSMPNRKTDTNNRLGFSTDFIGQNYGYPEASYAERGAIIQQHRLYQQGLMWTLAHHPRIPEHVRKEVSRWGMCRDEFIEGKGWQEQLYIREARRLVGNVVMTQHHCQGREIVVDPVGLAAYTMDSHHQQRYVDANGHVRNEGDVQVGGFSPYPISYQSIIPRKSECSNLLVPVCLSASHIAFGSIRMEPVFMVLGQSAATAAVHAIEQGVSVQSIDYDKLQERLLKDGQILEWTGPRRAPARAGFRIRDLDGFVQDDEGAAGSGFGMRSQSIHPYIGDGYRHDSNLDKGNQRLVFEFTPEVSGLYEVRLAYSSHPNRASNVPVILEANGKQTPLSINQRKQPESGGLFHSLSQLELLAGQPCKVTVSNQGTDGYVVVDAIQWIAVE